MYSQGLGMLEYQMDQRVKDELAKAESRRLVRLVKGQSNPALSWRFRWMMCGFGLRLVTWGASIEARFLPPARPVESSAR